MVNVTLNYGDISRQTLGVRRKRRRRDEAVNCSHLWKKRDYFR